MVRLRTAQPPGCGDMGRNGGWPKDRRRAARATRLSFAAAALLAVSSPALAQTDDPDLDRTRIDCPDRKAAGADCADAAATPGRASAAAAVETGAVYLPDLIVDLFPNPVAAVVPPLPTPDPRRDPAEGGLPPPVAGDRPTVAAPPPSGPIVSPTDLALAEPPRAIAGDFVPDEVLATVDGDAAVVQQIAAAFGLQVRSQRQSALLGATVVRYGIPDGRAVAVVLAQLAADGRALRREPNHVYSLQQAATIVNYAFDRIALDSKAASGENVRIAVIDTGIDDANPALSGVIAETFDAMPEVPVEGRDHGTSIDGLIAGVGPFQGMAPGAKIYHARAFEGGKSTMDVILAALDWAASRNVRIVNMSFVGPRNELLGIACANARALGMVLVAAAGNNGPKAPYGYPAAFEGVIAVTATDQKDALMQQANRGPYVYISAPGVDMLAPVGDGSDLVTGTSFAAAIVSGAIANLIHAAPERSADWVEKALASSARDLGAAGRDDDFGYGLLDAKAAQAAR